MSELTSPVVAPSRAAWLDEATDKDFCHLGYDNAAFCGATTGMIGVHGRYNGKSMCPTCGRPTCPRCAQLYDLERRLA